MSKLDVFLESLKTDFRLAQELGSTKEEIELIDSYIRKVESLINSNANRSDFEILQDRVQRKVDFFTVISIQFKKDLNYAVINKDYYGAFDYQLKHEAYKYAAAQIAAILTD